MTLLMLSLTSAIVFTGPCSSIQAKNCFCSGFTSISSHYWCHSWITVNLSGQFSLSLAFSLSWNHILLAILLVTVCVYLNLQLMTQYCNCQFSCLVIHLDSKFIKNRIIFFNTLLLAHCKMRKTYDKQNTIFSKQTPLDLLFRLPSCVFQCFFHHIYQNTNIQWFHWLINHTPLANMGHGFCTYHHNELVLTETVNVMLLLTNNFFYYLLLISRK